LGQPFGTIGLLNSVHVLDQCDPKLQRAWHVVALSQEVNTAKPHQVWLGGEAWVLVRLDGDLRAFRDRCPHRSAPLSAGTIVPGPLRDELQCGYHGWRFDGSGACTAIPALGPNATLPSRAHLDEAFGVVEHLGLIWLAPLTPITGCLSVPESNEPGFRWGTLSPTRVNVSAAALIDNFCDVAHFPFLHSATFGSDTSLEVADVNVETSEQGWVAGYVDTQEFTNREDPGVAEGIRPETQHRRATYVYRAPFIATLHLEYLEAGGTNVIVFAVQPETTTTSRMYTVIGRNDLSDDTALQEALAFEQRVLDEDLAFQTCGHAAFPLDVRAELHTRADRLSLEVRRILHRLVTSD
jgi:phenylpropionate dioxygenase-like ring-hydroxylating dioxygenase large terminal subunit